jgi:hypothetical protein
MLGTLEITLWREGLGREESVMTPIQLLLFLSQGLTHIAHIAQAGLEFVIPLSQPHQCWDYRCVPSGLANTP